MKNTSMKIGLRTVMSMLTLVALVHMSLPAVAQSLGRVSRVQIDGAERIDPQTILSYMTVKPGDDFDRAALSDSAKALYRTGLFADVTIEPRGGVLVVKIVENPLINQVAFEGNDDLENDELAGEVASRSRNVLSRNTVQGDVERIYELYRRSGRFSVQVDPKVIRLDQNRVNLVFEINEGPVSEIQGVKFVGNAAYSDDALRDAIASKETRWYRFLSNADSYDPDRLAYDEELLRRFYLKKGYVDFRVVSSVAELTQDKEAFFVTFTVDEGPRYKIENVSVDVAAAKGADPSLVEGDIYVDSGDWYSSTDVEDSVSDMVDTLGRAQYNFITVRPDIVRNVEAETVDITFRAQQTPRVFVERIDIKGNVRTEDKVIRREFEMAEGDALSRIKVGEAEKNLENLNFFETARVRPVAGSAPDQTVLEVDVEEKSTGEISIGGGFSTSEGPLADFQVRERNLLGKGQDLSFSTTLSGERTEFDVRFTEPYFLDRDLAAGVDLFHTTRDLQSESSYDQQRTGGALRLGYPLAKDLRQSLRYRLENNNIEDVDADASRFIADQEGERLTSALSQRLTLDKRDSILFPTEGAFTWLDAEVAGLGGDAQYVSGKLGSTYYYPVARNWVLNILGEAGAIGGYGDEDVRINERFFLGGNTLRGFETSGVGPRDTATNDALGGNLFYRGSVELSMPSGLPEELGVKGHIFSDFGSLWSIDESGAGISDENELRASAGIGVSWRSPFGPIRVDYAEPFQKESLDEEEKFRFSFGTRF